MSRIIYALSGQGRGHTSRVLAISAALRQRGHEVIFCCGGTAREILQAQDEPVIPVPALRHAMEGNTIRVVRTLYENLDTLLAKNRIVARLADLFESYEPDLLITDFEAFSQRAARRLDLPTISFNHQQVVTETRYALPLRLRPAKWLAEAVIRRVAPPEPAHLLLTSFFFPPLKNPARTTFVGPIIRPAVQACHPTPGEHVLVYFNEPEVSRYVLDVLQRIEARFILYNVEPPEQPAQYPNLTFKAPSIEGFLEDLAASRAVLCTAGFTLMSEALYLGKPLLVLPNRGIFEQTLNALFLHRERLGEAVIERPLTEADVVGFLDRLDDYAGLRPDRAACGNDAAVACIERVLEGLPVSGRPRRHPANHVESTKLAPPEEPKPAPVV